MIGDDRPSFIGPRDDVQFDQVIGNDAQFNYNKNIFTNSEVFLLASHEWKVILLGHIVTEIWGDDRPYFIGPGDDVQFDQVLGDDAKIDL